MIRRRSRPIILGASIASLLGCGIGGAPTNGVVETVNLSRASASFHWQSPGLLGMPLFGATGPAHRAGGSAQAPLAREL